MSQRLHGHVTQGAESVTPVSPGVLQRKCACGAHAMGGGQCRQCKNGGVLQRKAFGASDASRVPTIVNDVLDSPGQPLDATTRASMESRFGQDFSGVRVHTDALAAGAASALTARAFTARGDIVFGGGEYAPQTTSGRRLLSHELTHVVQQRAGVQLANGLGRAGDIYETRADAVAERVMNGQRAGAPGPTAPVEAAPGASKESRVTDTATRPLQMQQVSGQPGSANAVNAPKPELLRAWLEELLRTQALNNKINGAMARVLARAYLNRREISFPEAGLHATPSFLDQVVPGVAVEPSENEVCDAILSELTIKEGATGEDLADWGWRPPEAGTRGGTLSVIATWAIADVLGVDDWEEDVTKGAGKGVAKQIGKGIALHYTVQWLKGKGLVEIAEIVSGKLTKKVMGIFEKIHSALELLIVLQKPTKKAPSPREQIVANVRRWLADEQRAGEAAKKGAEEAAKKAAQEGVESSSQPLSGGYKTARDKTISR